MDIKMVRNVSLTVGGIAALAYALWPPDIQGDYMGVAGSLLGLPSLLNSRDLAPDTEEKA